MIGHLVEEVDFSETSPEGAVWSLTGREWGQPC